MFLSILAAAFVLASPPSAARSNGLKSELDSIAKNFHGVLGYSLHHIKKRERLSLLGDEPFPTASTIKLAILCAAMDKNQKGEIGYYDTRVYAEADKQGGAGFIQNYKPGTKLELKELLHLMITISDNTATVMLVKWLGVMNINGWLDSQGLRNTRLLTNLPESETGLLELRKKWGLGVTTPNEMAELMERVGDGRAGTPAVCDEMHRILNHQYFDGGIPSQIPPTVCVASKSGAVDESRSEVALVHSPSGDYVLCIYTKNNIDQRWTRDNEGEAAIRAISRAVYKHYHPKDKWTPPPGIEKF